MSLLKELLQLQSKQDIVEKKIIESEHDLGELLDQYLDKNKMFHFDGSAGLRNFNKIIRVLGYTDVDHFLGDNPGCIESMLEWVRDQRIDDWAESLESEIENVQESHNLNEDSYDESADFEDDVDKVDSSLKAALKITKSSKWNDWMRASVNNYQTDSVNQSKLLVTAIMKANKELDNLYNELVNAS